MESQERLEGLASYLDVDADLIEESTYRNDLFIVNPHKAKRGTSPQRAKVLIDQLRKVLESVFPGHETEKWNSDFFLREAHEHELIKVEMEQIERDIKGAQRDLPTIKSPYGICEKCDTTDLRGKQAKCPKCKGTMLRMGQRRAVRLHDVDKMAKKLRAKCEPTLRCIEELQAKMKEKRSEAMSRFTYDGIHAAIQLLKPEALDIGTHEVANTLYYLTPKADDSSHAQDHKNTLREVFDGKEPKDRLIEYDTDEGEYLVLTDSEADHELKQYIENYIDEVILPEMPAGSAPYFNEDSFFEDAQAEGRGHHLNRYDGSEIEIDVDGESLFIYRQN